MAVKSQQARIARDQFDRQANRFSNWEITRNREYMQRYFDFCGMTPSDTLLDVACGSGEFAVYCAHRIHGVTGVDVSTQMIALARQHAQKEQLDNIRFATEDVTALPIEDEQFSFVNCKSALHHIQDRPALFKEMVRCCRGGGRIAIQDIMAYESPEVNDFFETMEGLIDASHCYTCTFGELSALFTNNTICNHQTHRLWIELNLPAYIQHAVQTRNQQKELDQLIQSGRKCTDISSFFIRKNGVWHFKREIFIGVGQKA